MSLCNNCMYHYDCIAFHWGSAPCKWYTPLGEYDDDSAIDKMIEDGRREFYDEFMEYASQFDDDVYYV